MTSGRPFTKQRLRACLDHDEYRLHPQVWARLRDLHIDLSDAIHVLRHGMIYAEPEFDANIGQWRFTIQGETVDGKALSIIFTFVEIEGVLVLTISNERQ